MSASAKARTFEDRSRTYEKNRNPSAETLARMSAASSSRSAESREKTRLAALAQWARKRAAEAESTMATGHANDGMCPSKLGDVETLIGPRADQAPTQPGRPAETDE